MRDVPLHETAPAPAAPGTLVGEYAGYVDMIGLQMNYAF